MDDVGQQRQGASSTSAWQIKLNGKAGGDCRTTQKTTQQGMGSFL